MSKLYWLRRVSVKKYIGLFWTSNVGLKNECYAKIPHSFAMPGICLTIMQVYSNDNSLLNDYVPNTVLKLNLCLGVRAQKDQE